MFDKYINIPYKHLGRDFDGCDCFGLVWLVLKNERNILLPDFTDLNYCKEFYRKKEDIILNNLDDYAIQVKPPYKPFDGILFYSALSNNIVNHIGIMIDSGKFLHIKENKVSEVEKLTPYWLSRLYSGVRYFGKDNL